MIEPKPALIRLDNVWKTYQIETQKVDALCGVSLQIKKSQIVGITGRSGSGKSTLLHIVGLLDRPSSGTLTLQDVEASSLNDQKSSQLRNAAVGFVFQMNNLLPEFSALENVMMPGLIAGAERSRVMERAKLLLNSVDLGHRMGHRPAELSGGEQQRVAIARALLMKPPILLADEPTGNLDKKSADMVEQLLTGLCSELGVTMLLVTHDMALADRLPDRVVMEDGKILDAGGCL